VYTAIQIKTNERVFASRVRRTDGPFRCPNPKCNARVALRKGRYRLAHFAHISHLAKPDCDEYSGPQISTSQIRRPLGGVGAEREPQRDSRVRVGFTGDTSKNFCIVLELPRVDAGSWWEGKLLLRTPRGEVRLSHAQLVKIARLRVGAAEFYTLEKESPGNIDNSYWNLVSGPIEVLDRTNWTIFRDSIGVGARLPNRAPLAFGEGYWAIAVGNREEQLSKAATIEVLSVEHWESDWWVHRFSLGTSEEGHYEEARDAVLECFGRTVVAPRPQAYIVSPAPHHVSPDGSWFLATPIDQLVIRSTSRARPEIRAVPAHKVAFSVDQHFENITIDRPPKGRFDLTIEGEVVLTFEIGEAAVMTPQGIRVDFDKQSVDLLELQTAIAATSKLSTSTPFTFDLPHPDVAAIIRVDGLPIPPTDQASKRNLLAGGGCVFDAGPYGCVDTRARALPQAPSNSADVSNLRPLASWLLATATPTNQACAEDLRGIKWNRCPTWIRDLQSKSWPINLAPQVRLLRKLLQDKGLA
jgi:hypothetical protein